MARGKSGGDVVFVPPFVRLVHCARRWASGCDGGAAGFALLRHVAAGGVDRVLDIQRCAATAASYTGQRRGRRCG
eukprot:6194560-Pleurochrysis_carterae.AAC.3